MFVCIITLLLCSINGEEYMDYKNINERMKSYGMALLRQNNSDITYKSMDIGKSTQGKSMIAYCYGNCDSGTASVSMFLLLGGIHGREGITVMSCPFFVSQLIQQLQQNNAETISLLSSTMIWIIPCMNPDTYDTNIRLFKVTKVSQKLSLKTYGSFRKNMLDTCPMNQRRRRFDESGVDLNRNYPVCFDIDEEGSSSNPCSDIYRGVSPLSEKESQAFHFFLKQVSVKPTLAMSLHSYGRTLLYPFSCKRLGQTLSKNATDLFRKSVKEILHGVTPIYTTGQAWQIPDLYTVNGDIVDYLYVNHSIPAFNIELPPAYPQSTEQKGFWPSLNEHREEVMQILWNTFKLAGCNLVIERGIIQNRGYGVCHNVIIDDNESRFYSFLSPFQSIGFDGDSVFVQSTERTFLAKWNSSLSSYDYIWGERVVKVKPTVGNTTSSQPTLNDFSFAFSSDQVLNRFSMSHPFTVYSSLFVFQICLL